MLSLHGTSILTIYMYALACHVQVIARRTLAIVSLAVVESGCASPYVRRLAPSHSVVYVIETKSDWLHFTDVFSFYLYKFLLRKICRCGTCVQMGVPTLTEASTKA